MATEARPTIASTETLHLPPAAPQLTLTLTIADVAATPSKAFFFYSFSFSTSSDSFSTTSSLTAACWKNWIDREHPPQITVAPHPLAAAGLMPEDVSDDWIYNQRNMCKPPFQSKLNIFVHIDLNYMDWCHPEHNVQLHKYNWGSNSNGYNLSTHCQPTYT